MAKRMKALAYLGASTPIPQASRWLTLIIFLKEYKNNASRWAPILLRGHIGARVLTRTWAKGEASDVQAPFAGIRYVVFGSLDLGRPFSSPT